MTYLSAPCPHPGCRRVIRAPRPTALRLDVERHVAAEHAPHRYPPVSAPSSPDAGGGEAALAGAASVGAAPEDDQTTDAATADA